MAADFNHPITTDAYLTLLDEIRAQSALNAQMFAGSLTGVTNLPTGTIRWNPTSKIFESWSGSAWAALSDVYHIIVDSVSNPGVIPDGTLAAPGLRFALELGSGLYRAGASDVRLAIAGVDAMQANGADGTRFTYAGDGSSISFTRSGSLIGRLMATSVAAVLSNGAKLNAAGSGWITETASLGQISLQQTAMIARGAESQTVGAAVSAFTTWFTADKNGVYAGAAGVNKLATEGFVTGSYLPLAGGTLTGTLVHGNNAAAQWMNSDSTMAARFITAANDRTLYVDTHTQIALRPKGINPTPDFTNVSLLTNTGQWRITRQQSGTVYNSTWGPGGTYGTYAPLSCDVGATASEWRGLLIGHNGSSGAVGVLAFLSATGSHLMLATSNNYASGFTSFIAVNPSGDITSSGGIVLGSGVITVDRGSSPASSFPGLLVKGTGSNGYPRITLYETTAAAWTMYMAPSSQTLAWSQADPNLAIGNRLTLTYAAGDLTATGNVTAYSDDCLKENREPLGNYPFHHLQSIRYRRKDTGAIQVGISAQSLREVLPECVIEAEDGTLSVDYGRAALVVALQLARELERRTLH